MTTISDKDMGFKALQKTLESLKNGNTYVKVGILGEKAAAVDPAHQGEGGGEPMTNAQLMTIHEFGTDHLPERSVIRRTYDERKDDWIALLGKLLAPVYEGKATVRKVLNIVGFKAKWDMKNLILEGRVTPPDSPETVARKMKRGKGDGEPKALFESGHLANALDHAVVVEGQDVGGAAEGGAA